MDVLELLAAQGETISFDGGRTIPDTIVRTFNGVNEGHAAVLVFGSEVTDDELSVYLTDETDANGTVLHNSELDTLTLRRKVDYYGNKAKLKRGPVTVSQPLKREDGTPYGFVVRKSVAAS